MLRDELRDELLAFRKERDWEHPPYGGLRTLSTSIALEAPRAVHFLPKSALISPQASVSHFTTLFEYS